ncbi:redox-sensing transcriptional repressor Rex [Eubacteriales bacterium OttesenSCG-928-K08]|nr:redox-sensing transcriptional repressor Rex [Eubacteriales bacterium OttesenSCG-928-K08]
MNGRKVSEAVVRRLPRYYRRLELLKRKGVERISSSELAQQMNLNPSQVRQDLNCFGGFGQQGYGYHVSTLFDEIANILGLTQQYKLVIVGAGNIGQALVQYEGFRQQGFMVVALFDVNEKIVGSEIAGLPVLHVDELKQFIEENNVDIGIIAARRSAAQDIADTMADAGIRGIWNFVPTDVTADVPLENVHLSDSMLVLSYRLNEQGEK